MNRSFKSRSARLFVVLACLTGGSLFTASPAAADDRDIGTMFRVNDEDPLQNIPTPAERNAHPLEFGYYLQDLIARAQQALTQKDWARSAKFFEVIARIVPDQAITFSRLCTCYGELGRYDVAAANCGRAIQLPGALVVDHLRFIKFTLRKEKFTSTDATNIDASLEHLRAQKPELLVAPPPTDTAALQAAASAAVASAAAASASAAAQKAPAGAAPSASAKADFTYEEYQRQIHGLKNVPEKPAATPDRTPVNVPLEIETLSCQLAVRLKDPKRLSACVDGLKRVNADPRLVVSFEWSQALVSNDSKRADAILEQAKKLNMPPSALHAMELEQNQYLKPTGILGFLTRGTSGRISAVVATLLAVGGAVWWLLAGARRRKVVADTQPS